MKTTLYVQNAHNILSIPMCQNHRCIHIVYMYARIVFLCILIRKNYIFMYSNPSTFPTSFDLPHAAWRGRARGFALHGHGPAPVACCSDRRKWNCIRQSRSDSSVDSLAAMLFALALLAVSCYRSMRSWKVRRWWTIAVRLSWQTFGR